jgi:hypothetical protein
VKASYRRLIEEPTRDTQSSESNVKIHLKRRQRLPQQKIKDLISSLSTASLKEKKMLFKSDKMQSQMILIKLMQSSPTAKTEVVTTKTNLTMLTRRHIMAMAGLPIAEKELKREKLVVSEVAPQKRFQKEITAIPKINRFLDIAEKAPVDEL